MKRISALLIALLVLCCAFSTTAFAAEEKAFWVTHYNDLTAEGAGVIVTSTEGISAGTWNNYYAFAPVEGTDAYKIVEISIGIGTGAAVLPALPEGGFIYSINVGNDYPSLGAGYEGMPNYTSDNCNSMVAEVGNWIVGDQFVFTGLDLEGLTVPTSTSDVMWYDPAYVCTATYSVYEGGASTESTDDSVAESTEDSATESVEESEGSEDVSETESKADTSKEESKAATSTATSEAPAEEESNTMIWVIVGVVIVVVVAVVVVVAKKKK